MFINAYMSSIIYVAFVVNDITAHYVPLIIYKSDATHTAVICLLE